MTAIQQRPWSRFAFWGGLIQTILALCLLFLPVFATCMLYNNTCQHQSYLDFGTRTEVVLLSSIAVMGLIVALTSRDTNPRRRCIIRWVAVGLNSVFVFLTLCDLGIAFFPGALLIVLSAESCREK